MVNILVRSKVEDYDLWKPLFDSHAEIRRQNGSHGGTVFRNVDDPNEVYVLLQWDDVESARAFTASPELRERMQQAGVVDKPDVIFLDEVARPKM
jgi:quinol monooxygenase YgiN